MSEPVGICLKCDDEVDIDGIYGEFPILHKGCGGEVAVYVRIDLSEVPDVGA